MTRQSPISSLTINNPVDPLLTGVRSPARAGNIAVRVFNQGRLGRVAIAAVAADALAARRDGLLVLFEADRSGALADRVERLVGYKSELASRRETSLDSRRIGHWAALGLLDAAGRGQCRQVGRRGGEEYGLHYVCVCVCVGGNERVGESIC